MDLPPGQPRLTRRTPRALVYRKAKRRRRRWQRRRWRRRQQLRIYDLRMQLIIEKFFRDCYLRFWGSRLHTLAHTTYLLSVRAVFRYIRGTTFAARRQGPLGRTLCMEGNDGLSTSSSASPHVLYSIMETDHAREPTRDCRRHRRFAAAAKWGHP